MQVFAALFAGFVFGIGLVVSGMSNPAKVQNFLDVLAMRTGTWDGSLMLVMGGALVVAGIGFRFVFRRKQPLFADLFYLPSDRRFDVKLLAGAALFGIGWGIGGICPGPAIVSLPLMDRGILVFVPAMLLGMGLAKLLLTRDLVSRSDG